MSAATGAPVPASAIGSLTDDERTFVLGWLSARVSPDEMRRAIDAARAQTERRRAS